MKSIHIRFLFFLLLWNTYPAKAQLEFVPPIIAQIKNPQNLDGLLLLDTRDFHFMHGAPPLYPSTVQIIDPLHPWPPIFFANIKPGGEGPSGNGLFQNFRFHEAVRQLSLFLFDASAKNPSGIVIICDTSFMIRDTVGHHGFSLGGHEFQINSKGERLYMVVQDTVLNLARYTLNPADTAMQVTSQVIEISNRQNATVFRWNPLEHLPVTDSYRPFDDFDNYAFTKGWDWQHGNSLGFTHDGNIIYSFKYAGVGKISRATGKIIWKLGGKTPTIPVPAGGEYYFQHDFREMAPGIFTLFSNGDKKKHACRAITYRIDEQRSVSELVRIYEPDVPVFSVGFGNYQADENGMSLFNYGRYATPDEWQKIFEIADSDGHLHAEYYSPSLNFAYRVQHVRSWKLQRPEIVCDSGTLKINRASSQVMWYRMDGDTAVRAGEGLNWQPDRPGRYLAACRAGFGWLVTSTCDYK